MYREQYGEYAYWCSGLCTKCYYYPHEVIVPRNIFSAWLVIRNGYFLSQKISTVKLWKSRSFLQLFCLDSQDFFFVCVTFKRCWSLNSRSLQISLHHGVVDVEKGDRCPKRIDKRGKHPLFQKLTNAYFLRSFVAEGS